MKLVAFSSKKQGGKDSAARFISANAGILFGNVHVDTYYFAKPMKDFCTNYLGVEHHKVWGSDAQKNELTHVRWETLPNYQRLMPKTGFMTGRELLQWVGEDAFLEMDPNIWIRMFERDIENERATYDSLLGLDGEHLIPPIVGVVADPRKPEQINCIHRLGGKSIRLLRGPYEGSDRHVSETALDSYSNFDAIIDNRELTLEQTHRKVLKWLRHWGLVTGKVELSQINWNPPQIEALLP